MTIVIENILVATIVVLALSYVVFQLIKSMRLKSQPGKCNGCEGCSTECSAKSLLVKNLTYQGGKAGK